MRGKTQSSKVVSSHFSEWGASSLRQKFAIDSRSCSCSSVKAKWRRLKLKSGLRTGSAVAMKWTVTLSTIDNRLSNRTARAERAAVAMRVLLALLACLLVAAPAAQAALPRGFVGLYGDDAFFGDSSYRQAQFGMESRVGAETLRQPLDWGRVERSPGVYDFSAYDSFMADAAAAGLSVLPVLGAPPEFRSSRPESSASHAMYPPRSNAAYARFVSA